MSQDVSARDAGAGGQWGNSPPPAWKLWKLRPPPLLWTVDVVLFLFSFVFAPGLVSPPKIVDQIWGVFIFG